MESFHRCSAQGLNLPRMPSLTLTDPDMILPYDGSERQSSTPSPPSQLVYLSNLNARYSADNAASRPKKNFSRAWSHDDVNVTNPRRLSDIGEELSPAYSGGFEDEYEEAQTTHSPADAAGKDNNWSSSNSTVSAGSARQREASPQTVRGASPVQQETPSQTRDQEKENEKPGMNLAPEAKALVNGSPIASAAATGKASGEDFSSAILSSEAERILENAKKRLTVRGRN